MTHPFKNEFDFQIEADFKQDTHWPTYFNMIRSEELWTEDELNKIDYTAEAADFTINVEKDTEAEIPAPEVIMAVNDTGQSTPMARGMILVKSIQGRPCFRVFASCF